MMLKVRSQLSHFCPEVESDEAAAEVTERKEYVPCRKDVLDNKLWWVEVERGTPK